VSTVEVVAIVVGVFFVIGIGVGVLVVVAMSMLRPERRNRHAPPHQTRDESPPTGYGLNEGPGNTRPNWPDLT
jgi:hypothetical protein